MKIAIGVLCLTVGNVVAYYLGGVEFVVLTLVAEVGAVCLMAGVMERY